MERLYKRRVPGAAALINVELSIVLVNDKKIHLINKEWRKKDKPTDVLSFPQYSVEELVGLSKRVKNGEYFLWSLGDVVISVDTAKRQAKEKQISLAYELEVLLVHGIVHLLGYDHELGKNEARRMRRLEKILLTP